MQILTRFILTAIPILSGEVVAQVPQPTLEVEAFCRKRIVCGQGEVCRAKVTYGVGNLYAEGIKMYPVRGIHLEFEDGRQIGMVSQDGVAILGELDEFKTSLDCRTRFGDIDTFSLMESDALVFRLEELAEYTAGCDRDGDGQLVRDSSYGLFVDGQLVFESRMVALDCDQ